MALRCRHFFRKTEWQLTFFVRLADYAGRPIDLDKLDPDKMPDAMIVSFDGDETQLANIIKGLIRYPSIGPFVAFKFHCGDWTSTEPTERYDLLAFWSYRERSTSSRSICIPNSHD